MVRKYSAKAADKDSLRIVKQANTGNITPRLREDGLHDFVVNGLRCDACGGEIVADGICETPDGLIWLCRDCGEVDSKGKPGIPAYKKEIVKRHNTGNIIVKEIGDGWFEFRRKTPCIKCGRLPLIEIETITEENPDGELQEMGCDCWHEEVKDMDGSMDDVPF